MMYKDHEITKSAIIHADTGRPLYRVDGRYSKDAAHRPFLTTVQDARDWINDKLAAEEAA